jgi:hypothetical protein
MKPSVLKKRQRERAHLQIKKRPRRPSTNTSHTPFPFEPLTALYTKNCQIAALFKLNLGERFRQLHNHYLVPLLKPNPFSSFYEQSIQDYLVESRLRFQFKRLLNAYRLHTIHKRPLDSIDPITFSPIQEPICVYSMKDRRRYLFEADSLNKGIRKNLYHSQYTIPEPKEPIHVITNRPFTYVQLISIFEQLRSTKQRIEDLSIYRSLQFQIQVWKRYMHRQLRMTAIREELQNLKSLEGQDMLLDFIKNSMAATRFPLTERFETILESAVYWYPDHTLIGLLRTLCIKSYESNLFKIEIHEILLMQFANLFSRHFPKCSLWDQVEDRLIADTEALKELEALDVDQARRV